MEQSQSPPQQEGSPPPVAEGDGQAQRAPQQAPPAQGPSPQQAWPPAHGSWPQQQHPQQQHPQQQHPQQQHPQQQPGYPAQGSWPAWQQYPPHPPWGQTPYGYAPVGWGYPPAVPPWQQQAAYAAQLKAPPGQHAQELPWQLAGWWARVGAQVLDALFVWVPAGIILTALIISAEAADNGSATESALLVATIIATFLAIAAHLFYAPVLMMRRGRRNGQTLGKQICGIRVIRADGEPMPFSHAALRQIVYKSFGLLVASTFVPLFPWILNYLWPTWDEQHRALHDMAADTRVVSA